MEEENKQPQQLLISAESSAKIELDAKIFAVLS